eukprot:765067-Hanusia_phi.AAC.1
MPLFDLPHLTLSDTPHYTHTANKYKPRPPYPPAAEGSAKASRDVQQQLRLKSRQIGFLPPPPPIVPTRYSI